MSCQGTEIPHKWVTYAEKRPAVHGADHIAASRRMGALRDGCFARNRAREHLLSIFLDSIIHTQTLKVNIRVFNERRESERSVIWQKATGDLKVLAAHRQEMCAIGAFYLFACKSVDERRDVPKTDKMAKREKTG